MEEGKHWWNPGPASDTEGLEEDMQALFHKDDGTVVVQKWITGEQYAFKGMAKVCRDDG